MGNFWKKIRQLLFQNLVTLLLFTCRQIIFFVFLLLQSFFHIWDLSNYYSSKVFQTYTLSREAIWSLKPTHGHSLIHSFIIFGFRLICVVILLLSFVRLICCILLKHQQHSILNLKITSIACLINLKSVLFYFSNFCS